LRGDFQDLLVDDIRYHGNVELKQEITFWSHSKPD
jgi:hypothetical protein